MDSAETLSLEQEFNLRLFADQVQNLSADEAKTFLIEFNRAMMIRENLYRDLFKHYLGIDSISMSA